MIKSLQIPDAFQPNVLYVFHSHNPVDDVSLATRVLPERLHRAGIQVVHQPKTRQDIAFIDPGNTTWQIRFQQGQYSGEIYNVLDQKMYKSGQHVRQWSFEAARFRIRARDLLLDSGQISRQTLNYDRYNNELDRWEYDWGAGAPGALLRHTQTQYLWSSNSAYAAPGVNLLSLPYNRWIFDGAGKQAAYTAWRYDETALQDAPGVTGHASSYGTGQTVRGNNTSEQRFLDTTGGYSVTQRTYDIAGNAVTLKDPGGNTTTYGYNDDGSNHYACDVTP